MKMNRVSRSSMTDQFWTRIGDSLKNLLGPKWNPVWCVIIRSYWGEPELLFIIVPRESIFNVTMRTKMIFLWYPEGLGYVCVDLDLIVRVRMSDEMR